MLFWVLLPTLLNYVTSQDFCDAHNYPETAPTNYLRLSKELSQDEFAYVNNFKSLHCCATAFTTVEWFKDGQPYPWPGDISSFIINPASHNQTIYSQAVSLSDSGNYFCVVSNDTHQIEHHVALSVTSSGFVGPPKATYSPGTQIHKIGGTARFYCEAYVGNIQLPDARSDVVWTRVKNNFTEDPNPRHRQEIIYRDDKRVLGSFLTVHKVQSEDFGPYYCTFSNTADQFLQLATQLYQSEDEIEDWRVRDTTIKVCLGAGFAVISTLIIIVTTLRFRLRLQLFLKACRERLHPREDDEVDVTIMYHQMDSTIALSFIVHTLQHKYSYTCCTEQLSQHPATLKSEMGGQRLLVIMTPNVTGNVWSAKTIAESLQQFLRLHPKVICIFLQDLPIIDTKTDDGKSLKDSLARVHYITNAESQAKNFWTILQLGMPPQKKARARKSRESLEHLM